MHTFGRLILLPRVRQQRGHQFTTFRRVFFGVCCCCFYPRWNASTVHRDAGRPAGAPVPVQTLHGLHSRVCVCVCRWWGKTEQCESFTCQRTVHILCPSRDERSFSGGWPKLLPPKSWLEVGLAAHVHCVTQCGKSLT